jgi:alkanesulfonate monooxygenase SsuD/methylene tetrahydromethanopterin reductase-like flavin-dependent oxidoreductase (luciferase family)
MANTHDYPTKEIKAKELTKEHVLVGRSGGLSAVYEVIPLDMNRSTYTIATEHGSLRMHAEQAVNVYHEKRTASQINDSINAAIVSGSEESVWEGIDELAEDLFDSIALAMGPDHEDLDEVLAAARDYYGNNYSD